MTEPLAPTPTALAAEIITIPPEQLQAWIAEHLAHMSVAVIDELRAYCTPPALQANLRWADIASRAALAIAERLPHEPLAAGSANWARGNWAAFAVPKDAAVHYRCAAELYQQTDEHVIVARLYTNLVFVQTDQGEFDDALVSYKQAQPVLQALGEEGTFFGLRLEQNYGWLLHNQRRYADALQVYETSLALAQRLDEPVIALEIQVNRAVTRGEQGFVTEAIATLLAQREQAEQLSQELTIPRIDMILGEVFAILGRVAEGLRRFELARVGFSAQDAPMELGSILIGKAMLFERIGALKEARHNYETARVHFLEHEMWPQVGLALVQGATALRLYRTSDSLKLAAAWLDEAEAIWMARDEGEWLRQIEIERAALALVEKNADHALTLLSAKIEQQPLLDARRTLYRGDAYAMRWFNTQNPSDRVLSQHCYEEALAFAQREQEQRLQRSALLGMALLVIDDQPEQARSLLEQAADLDDDLRRELSVEELLATFADYTNDALPRLIRLAVTEGDALRVLSLTWRAKASLILDMIARARTAQLDVSTDHELEHLRNALASRRWMMANIAKPTSTQHEIDQHDEQTQALIARLRELRRLRNRETAIKTWSLDKPQDLLATMAADLLIEYTRFGDAIAAVVTDRAGHARIIELGTFSALRHPFRKLEFALTNVVKNGQDATRYGLRRAEWLDESRRILRRFFDQLVAPLALPEGARLLIAPCEGLMLLPFAALWDGERYLVEQHELTTVPSGALLAASASEAVGEESIVIGSSAGGLLQAMREEVRVVAEALPGSSVHFDQPNMIQFLRDMQPPRVLHLAAHTAHRGQSVLTALQMPDGLLSIDQCYELPLRGTELVTLSACVTAQGLDRGGGIFALQTAFFIAGARNVVSSLWGVGDQPTQIWMRYFYQHYSAGAAPALALRQTQLAMLNDQTCDHPAFWAGFMCSSLPAI